VEEVDMNEDGVGWGEYLWVKDSKTEKKKKRVDLGSFSIRKDTQILFQVRSYQAWNYWMWEGW
jgi:hypothetical protein